MTGPREFITADAAVKMLPDRETIHTFRSLPGMLLGADISRKAILDSLSRAGAEEIEIGGPACRKLGHGLVLWQGGEPLFIEATIEEPEKSG